jgi:hypothetical protein
MVPKPRSRPVEAVYPDLIDPDQSADHGLLFAGDGASTATLISDRRQAINRRAAIWWAFLYGNFHPRRRNSRRVVDQHDFWFDWHEPRVLYLALGVFLLSCTDALFTLNLLNAGAGEANAVMASMLETGIDRFVTAKIGITGLCLLVLVVAARRKFVGSFRVEHLLQSILFGYALLICYEIYMFWYVFGLSIVPGHLLIWPIHG